MGNHLQEPRCCVTEPGLLLVLLGTIWGELALCPKHPELDGVGDMAMGFVPWAGKAVQSGWKTA